MKHIYPDLNGPRLSVQHIVVADDESGETVRCTQFIVAGCGVDAVAVDLPADRVVELVLELQREYAKDLAALDPPYEASA